MARLGDVCSFQSGGTPSKIEPSYFNGSIPWISTVALNDGLIDADDAVEWITEKAIKESAAKVVPSNSIMVGTRVGVGKVAINTIPISTSQDIISLLDIDENIWLKAYICKVLIAKRAFLHSQARGATIKGIKIEVLANLLIPDIPIAQQRNIAVTIDKVTDLISMRRQQLEKLDELVKARFVEMFGDVIRNTKGFEKRKGADLFKISNGKAVPIEKRFDDGIPAYGGNGVSWYTDEVLFEKDSIVIGRVGFQSGNVHLVKGPLWITDNAMYISELYDESLSLVFLCEMMEQIDFTKQQDAGDLKKVTQKPFMEMGYILPPILFQKEYVDFVSGIDQSKAQIQQGLEKLETLKKSLMQQYFG